VRHFRWTYDIRVFFRPPPGRAGYFCFGKSSQNHWHRHDGFSDVLSLKLPCASRRARAGANSHIRVLRQSRLSRAPGCDARRHATEPKAHFDTAIHGLQFAGGCPLWRTRNGFDLAKRTPGRYICGL
jgi:hypothetical protein